MAPTITRNETCQEKLDIIRAEASGGNKGYVAKVQFVSDIWKEPYEHVTATIPFKSRYLSAFRDGFEITPDMLKSSEIEVEAEKSAKEMTEKYRPDLKEEDK